jgi:pimeloyl-ACP methyl ester carboxylesterase
MTEIPSAPPPSIPPRGPLPPVVSKRTWVDDRPAQYDLCGDGLPVLFLHGWGLAQHSYRDVLRRIAARGTKVYAPAQPGFGGTPELPRREFAMSGYARWVNGFLDAVKVHEPALVIGHSFGGGVAIRFAHDYGERVRSLVLVNSIGGSAWRRGSAIKTLAERPLWDWGLHFPADVFPLPQATKVLPVMLEDALPNLVRNPRAMWKVGNLARRVDLTRELEALKARGMPVTVLWGRKDGIIPKESFDALCAAVGQVGTVVEGTHSWLLASPDHFAEVITNSITVAHMARELERELGAAKHPDELRSLTDPE